MQKTQKWKILVTFLMIFQEREVACPHSFCIFWGNFRHKFRGTRPLTIVNHNWLRSNSYLCLYNCGVAVCLSGFNFLAEQVCPRCWVAALSNLCAQCWHLQCSICPPYLQLNTFPWGGGNKTKIGFPLAPYFFQFSLSPWVQKYIDDLWGPMGCAFFWVVIF